jgi:hypothetical protein
MQRLVSKRREEDVADEEVPTEDSLHRSGEGYDVGSRVKERLRILVRVYAHFAYRYNQRAHEAT